MTNITSLAIEQRRRTEWQRLPDELDDDEYGHMILAAIRELYITTGRATVFDAGRIILEDELPVGYADDLLLDETEYVQVTAEIGFYRKVQGSVNSIVGYTTDALSVTNADKPYIYLGATIKELENKRRMLFYKMTRYSIL